MAKDGNNRPVAIERNIVRFNLDSESFEPKMDEVVIEKRIELYINTKLIVVFVASPANIKELAVGYMLTEGIIDKTDEIDALEVTEDAIHTQIGKNISPMKTRPSFILSACTGAETVIYSRFMKKIGKFKKASMKTFSWKTVFESIMSLNSTAQIFEKTGGTHAAGIFSESIGAHGLAEDIGRHNAIDKVIGKVALEHEDFSQVILASTGRLTSEIVTKAATVGIPVIVSMSAPTDKGIEIAEIAHLTLIGFARGRRFNIYTHPERVG